MHVSLGESGYHIDHVVAGDTVTEVLKYVSYTRRSGRPAAPLTEEAIRAKRMTLEESRQLLRSYEDGMTGYTYLERD